MIDPEPVRVPLKPPPSRVLDAAKACLKILVDEGYEAYVAGGAVRDFLLGREVHDIDIATDALPEQIGDIFPWHLEVGKQFGVVTVKVEGHHFQVATFRKDGDYSDGRRPETVSFSDAYEDVQRRDFTINGLLWDPGYEEVLDWVGGIEDLKAEVVRAIGDPQQRFKEDHLRMLRAVRFASDLGFGIEPKTFEAIYANCGDISGVSAERIGEELSRLLTGTHPDCGLALLQDTGLLEQVLPEVALLQDCMQGPLHHPEGDVFMHTYIMLGNLPKPCERELAWAVLLHDTGKPSTREEIVREGAEAEEKDSISFKGHAAVSEQIARSVMERLRSCSVLTERVCYIVGNHMRLKDLPKMSKANRRKIYGRQVGAHPVFPWELELLRLDVGLGSPHQGPYEWAKDDYESWQDEPILPQPLADGHDVMALGVEPGPRIGQLLGELRDLQLNEEIQDRATALEWLCAKCNRPH